MAGGVDFETAMKDPAARFGSPATIVTDAGLSDGQKIALPEAVAEGLTAGPVVAGLRPEDLTDDTRLPGHAAPRRLSFEAVLGETLGSDLILIGRLGGIQATARCAPGLKVRPDDRLTLHADAGRLHFFSPESGRRL